MASIYRSRSLTGFGYPNMTRPSSYRARGRGLRVVIGRRIPGQRSHSVLTSLPRQAQPRTSQGAHAAFVGVVGHARAAHGTATAASNWAHMSINFNDPIEAALAARLQQSSIANVASSTSEAYVSQWNMFVQWCNSLAVPRQSLPAGDTKLKLKLQTTV